ncbi:MAG: hypothetical protein QXT53_03410 [Ignisphaera sp.]
MTRGYGLLTLVALFVTVLSIVIGQSSNSAVIVEINEDGVAKVYMNISVAEGITNVTLPIKPVDISMEISANTDIEWLLANNSLYIVSPRNATVSINYIANVTITNGVLQLNVSQPVTIKLVIAPNILLLSIPNETTFYSTMDNKTVIEFKGPATIMYTIMIYSTSTKTIATTSTMPAIVSTTTPTTITKSMTTTQTTSPQITLVTTSKIIPSLYTIITSVTTIINTATPLFSISLVMGVAIAVLIVVIVLVFLLIKRR